MPRKDGRCHGCENPAEVSNGYCRNCHNARGRTTKAKYGRRYWRYKLSADDLYFMWLYQGGRCDICKDRIDILEGNHVDHDSSCCPQARNSSCCGECIRSLLCGTCNQGLGNFKDSQYRLNEAIKYLARSS